MAGVVTNRSIREKRKIKARREAASAASDRVLPQEALPLPTLTDEELETFIKQGYLVFENVVSQDVNERIIREADRALDEAGFVPGVRNYSPIGNNMGAAVPDLVPIVMNANNNAVSGALASILGGDYILHKHLLGLNNDPGSRPQTVHKDSFAGFTMRRSHTPWWCMVMYYPQDTPVELAATSVVPGSQYMHPEGKVDERHLPGEVLEGYLRAWGTAERRMVCKAGTAVIVHKDIFHRGMDNTSQRRRWMFKYELLRTSLPSERPPLCLSPDPGLAPIHAHVAAWIAGSPAAAVLPVSGFPSDASPPKVVGAASEAERLGAAYRLSSEELLLLLASPAIDADEAAVRAVRHALAAALFRGGGEGEVDALLALAGEAARAGRPLVAATCLVALAESGCRLSERSASKAVDFLAAVAEARRPGGAGLRNVLAHAMLGLGLLGAAHPATRRQATEAVRSFLRWGVSAVEGINGCPSRLPLGEALMEAGLACVRLVQPGGSEAGLLAGMVALSARIARIEPSKEHPRLPGKGGAPGADQGLRYCMAFLITGLCRSGCGRSVAECYAALKAYGRVGPATPSEAWALQNRWCHLTDRDHAF
eukprot:Hpha_TRINITY_DN16904_c3_g4::TRINITY_DN16904_c3_g4_i14::g.54581::m.54581